MDKYIDINAVISWPQASVAVALLVVVIALPQWYAHQQTKAVKASLEATHTTLTQNNGGGSVKDALDRIEKTQKEQGETLASMQTEQQSQGQRITVLEAGEPRRRRPWHRGRLH